MITLRFVRSATCTPSASSISFVLPRLNESAPDFSAKTTDGMRSLADYRGKWLVLFSHPADFILVCTTEFMAFAARHSEFDAMGVELLGLSIDSLYAHIAWIRSIKQSFGVVINFPIIADLDMKVAKAYGMIQPGTSDTSAVRATFVIDPEGTLRAMVYYPMNAGRQVDEFVRLIQALQTAETELCSMPENWRPGQPVIVPPPATAAAADMRMSEGYDTADWYFSTRSL